MYYGPSSLKVWDTFDLHAEHFGGDFFCFEPGGGFMYEVGDLTLDLSNEIEEKLLELIERSKVDGKDLVYETFKDKVFETDQYIIY